MCKLVIQIMLFQQLDKSCIFEISNFVLPVVGGSASETRGWSNQSRVVGDLQPIDYELQCHGTASVAAVVQYYHDDDGVLLGLDLLLGLVLAFPRRDPCTDDLDECSSPLVLPSSLLGNSNLDDSEDDYPAPALALAPPRRDD